MSEPKPRSDRPNVTCVQANEKAPGTGYRGVDFLLPEEAQRVLHELRAVKRGGEDALLACAKHMGDIHLILTDVIMPRMGGGALVHALLKVRPALKVIYMSGYADDAIVRHGVLEAGTHFLGKPFTGTDLTWKVREVLDCVSAGQGQAHVAGVELNVQPQPPDGDALRALPTEVLDRLKRAVIAARHEEMVEIVESIRITEPDLAAGLMRMVDLFDYEGMRNVLGQHKCKKTVTGCI